MPPPTTTSVTAGQIMDRTAVLLNDSQKAVYTYAAVLPYLNMAIDYLQETLENNEMSPTNQTTDTVIEVDVGVTAIRSVEWPPPNYPFDLVEIQQLWERLAGSSEPFVEMDRKEFLSHYLDNLPIDSLREWTWLDQSIKFYDGGASTPREIKIDYIRAPINHALNENSIIGVINSRSQLSFKTAEYCAQFIGENETRAEKLKGEAQEAMDRILGISVKGRQAWAVRRRPFRAGYKARTSLA